MVTSVMQGTAGKHFRSENSDSLCNRELVLGRAAFGSFCFTWQEWGVIRSLHTQHGLVLGYLITTPSKKERLVNARQGILLRTL